LSADRYAPVVSDGHGGARLLSLHNWNAKSADCADKVHFYSFRNSTDFSSSSGVEKLRNALYASLKPDFYLKGSGRKLNRYRPTL
jgi:hypothetical protein